MKITTALSLGVLVAVALAGCHTSTAPTPVTPVATYPTSETFVSGIGPRSSASRLFITNAAGTATVKLVTAGPPSDIVVGFGIGIPHADNGNCILETTLVTAAGDAAVIAEPVDQGSYCVQVYDVGNVKGTVGFTVTIDHP